MLVTIQPYFAVHSVKELTHILLLVIWLMLQSNPVVNAKKCESEVPGEDGLPLLEHVFIYIPTLSAC